MNELKTKHELSLSNEEDSFLQFSLNDDFWTERKKKGKKKMKGGQLCVLLAGLFGDYAI